MRRVPAPPAGSEGLAISVAAVLLAVMMIGGFTVAAATAGVHGEAWVAAAAVAAMTLTGLLYAWRLGAYGASR